MISEPLNEASPKDIFKFSFRIIAIDFNKIMKNIPHMQNTSMMALLRV